MSDFSELILKADLNKTVLSGKYVIEKTERFLSETRRLCAVDTLLTKVFEGFITCPQAVAEGKKSRCLKIDTLDGQCSLFARLLPDAFVFYKCVGRAYYHNPVAVFF